MGCRRVRRLLLLLLLIPFAAAAPSGFDPDAAIDYLNQEDFHGLPTYVLEAVSQSGHHGTHWPTPDHPVLDAIHLREPQPRDPTDTKAAADRAYKANQRALHAIATAGYAPPETLLAAVAEGWDGTQWGDATTMNDDLWAILSLTAAGWSPSDPRLQAAAQHVKSQQRDDGAFRYGPMDNFPGPDLTGMALAALHRADALDSDAAVAARDFLESTRRPDGGHGNCQSTVWAAHGFYVLDGKIPAPELDYLASLQQVDGGLATSPSQSRSDAWCTAEAIPILRGQGMPWLGYEPTTITVPDHAYIGNQVTLTTSAANATWQIDATTLHGAVATYNADRLGDHLVMATAHGDGIYRQAFNFTISNRAPILPADPGLTASRLHDFRFAVDAHDPDGFPVAITWTLDGRSGTGPIEHRFATPGMHDLHVVATDPHGGRAEATWQVTVANQPPVVAATAVWRGSAFLNASATDPEGDPVVITWYTPQRHPQGNVEVDLAPGRHTVRALARDAYGATSYADIIIEVPSANSKAPPASVASGPSPSPAESQTGTHDGSTAPATPTIPNTPATSQEQQDLLAHDAHAEKPAPGVWWVATMVALLQRARHSRRQQEG